jgi:hypothetical protein
MHTQTQRERERERERVPFRPYVKRATAGSRSAAELATGKRFCDGDGALQRRWGKSGRCL